jgi:hypothetical protein
MNKVKMTKIFRVDKKEGMKKSKISREAIVSLGEALYRAEDVKGVKMQVVFKDNSFIAFKRSEMADTFEKIMDDEDDE